MSRIDMLTNEGCLALSRVTISPAKLYIEDALLMLDTSSSYFSSPQIASKLSWNANPAWITYSGGSTELAVDSNGNTIVVPSNAPSIDLESSLAIVLPKNTNWGGTTNKLIPSSYLPTLVSDTLTTKSALDIDFTCLPKNSITYNTIGVRARLYYPIESYSPSNIKYVNDVVVMFNDSYYKCISDYIATPSSQPPSLDTEHWEPISIDTSSRLPGADNFKAITDDYILLYVSRLGSDVTLSEGLEIDYKLRLYITNADSTDAIKDRIYFNTLGPEFGQDVQLSLLASIASAFRSIRDVANGTGGV